MCLFLSDVDILWNITQTQASRTAYACKSAGSFVRCIRAPVQRVGKGGAAQRVADEHEFKQAQHAGQVRYQRPPLRRQQLLRWEGWSLR